MLKKGVHVKLVQLLQPTHKGRVKNKWDSAWLGMVYYAV